MNRRGFAIISLIITLASTAGGLYVTDLVLKDQLGIGVVDLVNFVLNIDKTMEDAPFISEGAVPEIIYDPLIAEQGNLTALFTLASENLQSINSEPDVNSVLNAIFEEDYNIYLFTIFNESYKVFDWSIGISNGNITRFESGMTGEYDVVIQLDHSVFSNVLKGSVSQETIKDFIKNKQLRFSPILEVTRVTRALPEIIRIIQEQRAQLT